MPPTERTELQESLVTIYTAQGYTEVRITSYGEMLCKKGDTLPPDRYALPTEDTDAGRAEFALLLLWAWQNLHNIELVNLPLTSHRYVTSVRYGWSKEEQRPIYKRGEADNPQEAFVMALAAALRARTGEGE